MTINESHSFTYTVLKLREDSLMCKNLKASVSDFEEMAQVARFSSILDPLQKHTLTLIRFDDSDEVQMPEREDFIRLFKTAAYINSCLLNLRRHIYHSIYLKHFKGMIDESGATVNKDGLRKYGGNARFYIEVAEAYLRKIGTYDSSFRKKLVEYLSREHTDPDVHTFLSEFMMRFKMSYSDVQYFLSNVYQDTRIIHYSDHVRLALLSKMPVDGFWESNAVLEQLDRVSTEYDLCLLREQLNDQISYKAVKMANGILSDELLDHYVETLKKTCIDFLNNLPSLKIKGKLSSMFSKRIENLIIEMRHDLPLNDRFTDDLKRMGQDLDELVDAPLTSLAVGLGSILDRSGIRSSTLWLSEEELDIRLQSLNARYHHDLLTLSSFRKRRIIDDVSFIKEMEVLCDPKKWDALVRSQSAFLVETFFHQKAKTVRPLGLEETFERYHRKEDHGSWIQFVENCCKKETSLSKKVFYEIFLKGNIAMKVSGLLDEYRHEFFDPVRLKNKRNQNLSPLTHSEIILFVFYIELFKHAMGVPLEKEQAFHESISVAGRSFDSVMFSSELNLIKTSNSYLEKYGLMPFNLKNYCDSLVIYSLRISKENPLPFFMDMERHIRETYGFEIVRSLKR